MSDEKKICPFLGFERIGLYLIAVDRTSCGLTHHGCTSVVDGDAPDFNVCSGLPEEDKQGVRSLFGSTLLRVFPQGEAKLGMGISFKRWLEIVEKNTS